MENDKDYIKLQDVGTKVDMKDIKVTICCTIL